MMGEMGSMDVNDYLSAPEKSPSLAHVLDGCKKQKENSSWHIEQSVYDHLQLTLDVLDKLLPTLGPNYLAYLGQKIGGVSRSELVRFVALTHDIGKDVPGIRQDADDVYDPFNKGHALKRTTYKGHEEAGGLAIVPIAQDIGFDQEAVDYIGFLTANHDFIHQAVEAIFKGEDEKIALRRARNNVGPLFPELLLHTLADMKGGTLDQVGKEEFDFREKLLLRLIAEQENQFPQSQPQQPQADSKW